MFTLRCHHQPLAAVGRSPLQASPGLPRWRQAAVPAPLPMSTMTSRHSLASRAAISIPPYVLVHPFCKTFGIDREWGIERVEKKEGEDEKVKLWFLLKGVDESKVNDEVEVDLTCDSNVLTIKRTNQVANADELLDVRLLLTAGYSRNGIKVEKGKRDDGMVLEVTIIRKITEFDTININ